MTPSRPIICLTPVRNEAWILPVFLGAADVWADHIIIADQQSTDDSKSICRSHPKVHVLNNPSSEYNEENYRRIALDHARTLHSGALIVAIDADEILSGPAISWLQSEAVHQASPGQTWSLRWINLRAGLQQAWSPLDFPVVYVDDGAPYAGQLIHSPRIPNAARAQLVDKPGVGLIHLQYLCNDRLQCKQRWYQALEHVRFPNKSAVKTFRTYHQLENIGSEGCFSFAKEDLEGSGARAEDLVALQHATQPWYWWDAQVLDWFGRFGLRSFRKLDIWDVDWNQKVAAGCPGWTQGRIVDPRSAWDKDILNYLKRTQCRYGSARQRRIDRLLRLFW